MLDDLKIKKNSITLTILKFMMGKFSDRELTVGKASLFCYSLGDSDKLR